MNGDVAFADARVGTHVLASRLHLPALRFRAMVFANCGHVGNASESAGVHMRAFCAAVLMLCGCSGRFIEEHTSVGLCEASRFTDFAFVGTIDPVGLPYSIQRPVVAQRESATDVLVHVHSTVFGVVPQRATILGTVGLDGSSTAGRLWDDGHVPVATLRFGFLEDGRMLLGMPHGLQDGGFTFATGTDRQTEWVSAEDLPSVTERYRTDSTIVCPTQGIGIRRDGGTSYVWNHDGVTDGGTSLDDGGSASPDAGP